MSSRIWFDEWASVIRTVIVGIVAYSALIGLLRVSGKRTLAKMNAFDLIVTVSLGSILASILLSKNVAVVDGIAAFTTLIALQYAVAWASVRSAAVRRLVKAEPRLLVFQGTILETAMKEERVTQAALLAVLREHGHADLAELEAVVLETNGTFSVVKTGGASAQALRSLE